MVLHRCGLQTQQKFAEVLRHDGGVQIRVTPQLAAAFETAARDMTHKEVELRGGPSGPTLTKIASGEGTISPASARKLEVAFGWERGTVRRIADGETGTDTVPPLRAARERRGWSEYRMAQTLGVSPQQVDRWERGEEELPADRVSLLRELFTPSELAQALAQALADAAGQ